MFRIYLLKPIIAKNVKFNLNLVTIYSLQQSKKPVFTGFFKTNLFSRRTDFTFFAFLGSSS